MGSIGDCFDNSLAESFFGSPAARAARPAPLADEVSAGLGDLRLRGGLLQPSPPALLDRPHQPGGVRISPHHRRRCCMITEATCPGNRVDRMTMRLHLYRIHVEECSVIFPSAQRLWWATCGRPYPARGGFKRRVPRGPPHQDKGRAAWPLEGHARLAAPGGFSASAAESDTPRAIPLSKGKLTVRLARQMVNTAGHLSITEVGRRYGLSRSTVMTLVTEWSQRMQARWRKRTCRVLLVDETSLRRRHRYVTGASNGEAGVALAVAGHRDFRAETTTSTLEHQRWPCCAKKLLRATPNEVARTWEGG